jgi:hypothetical protein
MSDAANALAADAFAMVTYIRSNWSSFSSGANSAQVWQLTGDYAAGVIGATECIVGLMAMLSLTEWALLLAAVGITGWALWNTFLCFHQQGG